MYKLPIEKGGVGSGRKKIKFNDELKLDPKKIKEAEESHETVKKLFEKKSKEERKINQIEKEKKFKRQKDMVGKRFGTVDHYTKDMLGQPNKRLILELDGKKYITKDGVSKINVNYEINRFKNGTFSMSELKRWQYDNFGTEVKQKSSIKLPIEKGGYGSGRNKTRVTNDNKKEYTWGHINDKLSYEGFSPKQISRIASYVVKETGKPIMGNKWKISWNNLNSALFNSGFSPKKIGNIRSYLD